jgi:hypothetical protein
MVTDAGNDLGMCGLNEQGPDAADEGCWIPDDTP